MQELAGKKAFVTGRASGIGLALNRAFAQSGMKVMLADIETDVLSAAVKSLDEFGEVRGITCDVADPDSVDRAAQAPYEAFGNVHVVCNNAGGGTRSGLDNISLDNWPWVFDVNVMGVLAQHSHFPSPHPGPRGGRPLHQHPFDGRHCGRPILQS